MEEILDKRDRIIALENYKNYDVFRSNDEEERDIYYYLVLADGKYYILSISSDLIQGKFQEFYYPVSVQNFSYLAYKSKDFEEDIRDILLKK